MKRALGAAALAGLTLSGCILGVEPPGAPPRGVWRAPEERPGPAPAECRKPGAACRWSPGYRHWDGGREVWIPGRWELGNDAHDLVSNSEP